jgi:RimJ/RimL family protein N-acetyltransferase
VYPQNKSSMRVLEKNGMTKVDEVNEYSKKLATYQNTIKFLIKDTKQVFLRVMYIPIFQYK